MQDFVEIHAAETPVPYILYEAEMMRVERRQKRHFILIIVLVFSLLVSNLAWLYAWTQYDYTSEEITVDGGERGIADYIGHDGDINNGEDKSQTENAD